MWIKKVWEILKKIIKSKIFLFSLFLSLCVYHLIYVENIRKKDAQISKLISEILIKETLVQKFNLNIIPEGTIIWMNGDETTYDSTRIDVPKGQRYEWYNIGIFNEKQMMVYNIKVPFYALGLFKLGMKIKKPNNNNNQLPKNFYEKRNPRKKISYINS
jgi:hypothetical protein